MISGIREKRKITFDKKRITSNIIRQIAEIINGESEIEKNDINVLLLFSLDATDDSSYESQSPIIYESGSLLDSKPIDKINMKFATHRYVKNIEVQIKHSVDKSNDNYILVSGDDTTWVNGVINRFNEIITLCESQPPYRKWTPLFALVFILAATIGYFRLILSPLNKINHHFYVLLGFGEIIGAFFLLLFFMVQSQLLWPAIELQTGPVYLQASRKKRNLLISILTLIVLPLIIAFVYDLLKKAL